MKKANVLKRVFAAILAVAIIVAACPVMSFALMTDDGFYYTESDGEITITNYKKDVIDIVVPSEIDGKPVTAIGDGAFSNLSCVTVDEEQFSRKITLPASIKEIGFLSFGMTCISEININELTNLEHIGAYAFMDSMLTGDIILSDSVQYVGPSAFTSTCITSLHLGKNVNIPQQESSKAVWSAYFSKTSGGVDVIPFMKEWNSTASEMSIAQACECLEKITVDTKNPYYRSVNGVLYSKDMTKLYAYPTGKTDALFKIPATVDAFYNAFGGLYIYPIKTLLGTFDLMDRIGNNNVMFKNDNSGMHNSCKFSSNLKTIILSERITEISDVAFYNADIQRIYITRSVQTIGQKAFWHCTDLETVGFSRDSVFTTLPKECFRDCTSLKNVTFGCINYLEALSFGNCSSLESIDLTNVKGISSTAFDGCVNLTDIVYQDTDSEDKATVSAQAFDNQPALETVMLGNSVEAVEAKAFANCENLTTVYISDEIENIDATAFNGCDNLTIVCPTEECYAYEYATENSISVTTLQIMPIANQTYTGEQITPELTIKAGGSVLGDNDYSAYYKDNIDVGLASVTVLGEGDYSVFASVGKFAIIQRDINDGVIVSEIPQQLGFGDAVEPEITVTFNEKVLTQDVDYIVEYADNAEPGTATMAIIGINNFTGIYTSEFVIAEPNYGDANDDGIIDTADYAMVREYVVCQGFLSETQKMLADWNGDGVVDAIDVIAIDLIIHKVI